MDSEELCVYHIHRMTVDLTFSLLGYVYQTQLIPSHHYFFFFCLFKAAPVAYGGSQARGRIRDAAASLQHSHSNVGSEPHLPPTPQLMATPDP